MLRCSLSGTLLMLAEFIMDAQFKIVFCKRQTIKIKCTTYALVFISSLHSLLFCGIIQAIYMYTSKSRRLLIIENGGT